MIPDEFVDRFIENILLMEKNHHILSQAIPQDRLMELERRVMENPPRLLHIDKSEVNQVWNIRVGGTWTKTGVSILRLYTV